MSNNTPAIVLDTENKAVAGVLTAIRSTLKDGGRYAAYVAEFAVTHETVKDHAAALAGAVLPNAEKVQKKDGVRTPYGNAVQAAGNGLRAALGKADKPAKTPDYLRLAKQACENAYEKGGIECDDILRAIAETLGYDDSDIVHMLLNQSASVTGDAALAA